MDNRRSLTILESLSSRKRIDVSQSRVLLWNDFDPEGNIESILAHVDGYAKQIIDELLTWLAALKETTIRHQRLVDFLALSDRSSLWWYTPLQEKDFARSNYLLDVFRVRALELLIEKEGYRCLHYAGSDPRLHRVLRDWCGARGLRYKAHLDPTAALKRLTSMIRLPQVVRGLRSWIYLAVHKVRESRLRRVPLRHAQKSLDIFTYFPNVDLKQLEEGRFRSRYWEDLHGMLDDLETPRHWFWVYAGLGQGRYSDAIRLRDLCNEQTDGRATYHLIEEFASPATLWTTLIHYLRMYVRCSLLRFGHRFQLPGSLVNFFPLIEETVRESFFGVPLLIAIFQHYTYERIAARLHPESVALFTWENQPWNLALIAAWKKHLKGLTVAYQHVPARILDLRNYWTKSDLEQSGTRPVPIPDLLIVIGETSHSHYLDLGFPRARLRKCEALRFMYLDGAAHWQSAAFDRPRKLLVLTNLYAEQSIYQLKLLNSAYRAGALQSFDEILIKPHPFCPLKRILKEYHASFPFVETDEPLDRLLRSCDVVFSCNNSSTAAEIACAGKPIILARMPGELNTSPLFGYCDIPMVYGSAELIQFLAAPEIPVLPEDFFYFDPALPRWRSLLEELQLQ